ncbi:MAG: MaoC family dehydratase [Sphingobium sp.]|jgi:acyl dehydratase|nr:MaoC family dehydratase [Sphingobium sp.]MCP5399772.1 MaoC family dehydratase [Sphingomonas sp.]
MAIYLDDLTVGDKAQFGRYEVTREEVIEFASKYDPQDFHLDDEAAAKGLFGKIAASGWHTAGMTMRMQVEHWKETGLDKASLGGAGMDEIRWTRPVYPGDVLSCETEVLEIKPSRSKPDRGFLKSRWTTFNQNGEPVMTVITTGILLRRPKAG